MKKICHPNQLSFFEILKDIRPKNTEFSSFNVDLLFRETLTEAIKGCSYSRLQIAIRMSELLGREITKNAIDSWTAESREGMNHIPAANLPAFCQVTGSIEPMRILADLNDCYVIQGADALSLELKKIEDQKQKLSEKERAVKTILRELGEMGK